MAPVWKPALICCFQGKTGALLDPKPQTNPRKIQKKGSLPGGRIATPGRSGTTVAILAPRAHPSPQGPSPGPNSPPSPSSAGRPACQSARGRASIGRSRPPASPPAHQCPRSAWPGSGPGTGPSPCRTQSLPAAPCSSWLWR